MKLGIFILGMTLAGMMAAQELSPDANFLTVGPDDSSYLSHEFSFTFGRTTGKPYSAEEVTKSIRVLGDGNRIVNTTTVRIYRDNQGRVRREVTLARGGSDVKKTFITISDPVSGAQYSLDPDTKIARRSHDFLQLTESMDDLNKRLKSLKVDLKGFDPKVLQVRPLDLKGLDDKMVSIEPNISRAQDLAMIHTGQVRGKGVTETHEDLGTQQIAGVEAEGSKDTTLIPAGVIGNERPMTITSERWTAKDLGIDVKSINDDPRFGRTEFTVSDLRHSEPDAAMFRVPSDYKLLGEGGSSEKK